MQSSSIVRYHGLRLLALRLAAVAGVSLVLCGCASFWDDVTSRDYDWSFKNTFTKTDPMVVLRDSNDGYARSKALAALREPLQNGGTQKDQDTVVEVLKTSATRDQEPLCRITALRTLGTFKDPRSAEIVESAYLQNMTFGQEMNGLIRQQCLASLADTGGPIALKRLVLVAKEPAANGNESDRQETLDRRLTAVRGLAKFKEPEAAAALTYLLKTEKDIAMRDRSLESLQASTGKRLPADSPQWEAYLKAGTPSDVQAVGGSGAQGSVSPVSLKNGAAPR